MSLEDSILTELILRITLRPPLLASQVLTGLFLLRVNLPPFLLALQNRPPPRGERLVNQEKSIHGEEDDVEVIVHQ